MGADNSMYPGALVGALALTLILFFVSRDTGDTERTSANFRSFQWTYLRVYLLMMLGDWLQGPYVYALYKSYGYEQKDIAELFVAGFGSSMVFGTFVGSLADRHGRKRFAILYCVTYIASCVTKHFSTYGVLMLGRLLGGIATSLLFSVFEAWLVAEHNRRGFDASWVGGTFSKAQFGNSLVAIAAGLVAQPFADSFKLTRVGAEGSSFHVGGYVTPFDLATLVLAVGMCVITCSWGENAAGADSGDSGCSGASLARGMRYITGNRGVMLCGLTQSLFEGSMYTFVFMWTPALSPPKGPSPPFGLIFATFMTLSMAGSCVFSLLARRMAISRILTITLAVSAAAMLLPCLFQDSIGMVFLGFLVFELCVGLYFPSMYTLKSKIVPEDARAAIYNLYRVPLNVIVLSVLLTDMPRHTAFACCVAMLALGFVLASALHGIVMHKTANQSASVELGALLGNANDDEEKTSQ